jgi:hypothetical protein
VLSGINNQIPHFTDMDIAISGWPSACTSGDYSCYQLQLTAQLTSLKTAYSKFQYYEVENEADLKISQSDLDNKYTKAIAAMNTVKRTWITARSC